MKSVHLIISGEVQGVGFRSWLKNQAINLNLTGWVRNRNDDTVEAVAQGSPGNIKRLIAVCQKGPATSRVEDVIVRTLPEGNLKKFEIKPTA